MIPNDENKKRNRNDVVPPSRQAAARLVRAQIDNIYENNVNSEANRPIKQPQTEYINPYKRTHTINPQPDMDQWKKYHTAWQNYYQQYYEGYYTHHLQKALATQPSQTKPEEQPLTKKEVIFDLRQELLEKVQESAIKVKKSRHFIPIASGLIVVLIFLFLQFNRLIISNVVAYVSPGSIDPQNIVIDPNSTEIASAEPKLIIPKINIDVPVVYEIGSDHDSQMNAMTKGVAHFSIPGANSIPGQIGNTVISGHSSNDLLDSGDYKFIFAQLDKLNIGDTIYLNYKSVRYTYTITKKETVKPSQVDKLIYPTTKPILTLITCTPIGTSINRLLVTAEQISPDPGQSIAAPVADEPTDGTSIPGNSQTLFERIFGINKNEL